jgi:hypothetical protein
MGGKPGGPAFFGLEGRVGLREAGRRAVGCAGAPVGI